MDLISKIIEDTKKKRELRNIDNNVILPEVQNLLRLNPSLREFLTEHDPKNVSRSGKYKELIKEIRATLRRTYGVFVKSDIQLFNEKLEELKVLTDNNTPLDDLKDATREILRLHQSTRERLLMYPFVYSDLWKEIGTPTNILDLGSGFNPISYPFMKLNEVAYVAAELNQSDCDILNKYFDIMKGYGLKGKAIQINLNQEEDIQRLSSFSADVCFIFKVLDILKTGHKKDLLNIINSRIIIASFPTETISGKKMTFKRRIWLEKICEQSGWKYTIKEIGEEVFYIIRK